MERVEQDQSRAESAGMGTRDDRGQADSAKSKATETETQASSRAILTSRAQPEYRPCGVSVFTARLITDPAGKEKMGCGARLARPTIRNREYRPHRERIPTLRGKFGTVIATDMPQERPSERSHGA
jgi:hypothetical protein